MITKDAVKHVKGKDELIIEKNDRSNRYETLVIEVDNLERQLEEQRK
jgi:hypothetical protein